MISKSTGHIKDRRSTRRSYNQMSRIPGQSGQRKEQHQRAEIRKLQRRINALKAPQKPLRGQNQRLKKQLAAVQKQLAAEQKTTSIQEGLLTLIRGARKFKPDYDREYAEEIKREWNLVSRWHEEQKTKGVQGRSLCEIRRSLDDKSSGIPGWFGPYVRRGASSQPSKAARKTGSAIGLRQQEADPDTDDEDAPTRKCPCPACGKNKGPAKAQCPECDAMLRAESCECKRTHGGPSILKKGGYCDKCGKPLKIKCNGQNCGAVLSIWTKTSETFSLTTKCPNCRKKTGVEYLQRLNGAP